MPKVNKVRSCFKRVFFWLRRKTRVLLELKKQDITAVKANVFLFVKHLFKNIINHLFSYNDYAAEIDASREDVKNQLIKYLKSSHGYQTTSECIVKRVKNTEWHLVSEDKESSVTKCVFNGIPSKFLWNISDISSGKSLLEFKFKLSKTIWKCLFARGIILILAILAFCPSLRSEIDLGMIIVYLILLLVNVICFASLINLILRYRGFASDLLQSFSKDCLVPCKD